MTEQERSILQELVLRPNGAIIRDPALREVVNGLADKVWVCDPHQMGSGLFTRITDEGKAALRSEITG